MVPVIRYGESSAALVARLPAKDVAVSSEPEAGARSRPGALCYRPNGAITRLCAPVRVASISRVQSLVRAWGAPLRPLIQRAVRQPAALAALPFSLQNGLPLLFQDQTRVLLPHGLPPPASSWTEPAATQTLRDAFTEPRLRQLEALANDGQRLFARSLIARAAAEFLAGLLTEIEYDEAIGLILRDAQALPLAAPADGAASSPAPQASTQPGAAAANLPPQPPVADLSLPAIGPAPQAGGIEQMRRHAADALGAGTAPAVIELLAQVVARGAARGLPADASLRELVPLFRANARPDEALRQWIAAAPSGLPFEKRVAAMSNGFRVDNGPWLISQLQQRDYLFRGDARPWQQIRQAGGFRVDGKLPQGSVPAAEHVHDHDFNFLTSRFEPFTRQSNEFGTRIYVTRPPDNQRTFKSPGGETMFGGPTHFSTNALPPGHVAFPKGISSWWGWKGDPSNGIDPVLYRQQQSSFVDTYEATRLAPFPYENFDFSQLSPIQFWRIGHSQVASEQEVRVSAPIAADRIVFEINVDRYSRQITGFNVLAHPGLANP